MLLTQVVNAISEKSGYSPEEITSIIIPTADESFGDLTISGYYLAKKLKQNPKKIAEELSAKLDSIEFFKKTEPVNGYVNIFYDRSWLSERTLETVLSGFESEKHHIGSGKRVIIEFSSPNIAKPMGVGHLRSTIIGNALSNIYSFLGFEVVKINYLGDWGVQFGKLIYGFKLYGDSEELEREPINHLNDIYVKTSQNMTETGIIESRLLFSKLEQRDPEMIGLWKRFRDLSIKDFEKTYETLGITFDRFEGESDYYDKLDSTLELLTQKGLLVFSEEAYGIDLCKFGLGFAIIKKKDGTSIYTSREISAAISRYEKYRFEKMIYEVGGEQKLHFQQLSKILALLGYGWHDRLVHVDHGLYLGTDGKKLSTRKGTSLKLSDLWTEVRNKVIDYYLAHEIDPASVDNRQLDLITRAAIFYSDLKTDRSKDVIFNPEQIVSFDGNTGPYLLYGFARANSILKKAGYENVTHAVKESPDELEFRLIKAISSFPEHVIAAYMYNDPSRVAGFAFDVSKKFNQFYLHCPVLNSPKQEYRLQIVRAYQIVLGLSLTLMGIEPLDEM